MLLVRTIILFSVYSFLGWMIETVYCSVRERRFISRGFLIGPICPIYAVGSLFVLCLLEPFSKNFFLTFALGTVVCSSIEYFASYLLEKIFKKSWWDYKDYPLNFNGRITLFYSLAWGGLCLILVSFVHPTLTRTLRFIPNNFLVYYAVFFSIVFISDIIYSIHDVIQFNRRFAAVSLIFDRIDKMKNMIALSAGDKKLKLENELASLLIQQEAFIKNHVHKMRRILNSFPKLRVSKTDRLSIREIIHQHIVRH
ncbi:MAG: putative ABC transporter permease [Clostridiaceae bacterium]|nr:putative ABC transporter permease [Clostridiaceae bacterium]